MSKKLKITEDQLKRIMVTNLNEQSEGMDTDVSAEAERMTDSFVTQFKELVGDNQELIDKLMVDLSNKLATKGDESSNDETFNQEPSVGDELGVNYEVNESVIKIKSEFNRFL
jgi:transcription elongation factor GreA-like protein